MKIQILKSKDSQFYWRIVARNGRILATSEMYKSKQSCVKTVRGVECDFTQRYTGFEDLTK